jgi:hypothetical protein
MAAFGVRFAVSSRERFHALRALFLEVKKDKDAEEFRDPAAWVGLVPDEIKGNFEWPSDAERQEWLTVRAVTPIAIGLPADQLGGGWNFYSVFESFENGEYTLLSCEMVGDNVAEMQIDPWSYPYGGLGPMIALAEAFGFTVLGVNECGRYEPRAELVARARHGGSEGVA